MREILFRGKKESNNNWVEGFIFKSLYGFSQIREIKDYDGDVYIDDYDVREETIGQYTGKTDINGVKIFEGDIIKISDDPTTYGTFAGELYEVYFRDCCFRIKPKNDKIQNGLTLRFFYECEVIGNIHDNPEILTRSLKG